MERIESEVKRKNLSSEDGKKSEKLDFIEENVEDRIKEISRNSSDADISANFTNIYSEISNLYVKIKALRSAGNRKCSKKKCDNNRKAIKKLKVEVAFLKNINVTQVNETIVQINTFQTTVTDLQTSVTKVNNCFSDINSADCASAAFKNLINEEDNIKFKTRQSSSEPLIPILKSVIACMAKTNDSLCTDKFK